MKGITRGFGGRPLRWFARLAVAPPVLLAACLWCESVLQVTDRGADLVVSSNDLQAFLKEDEQPIPDENRELQPRQQQNRANKDAGEENAGDAAEPGTATDAPSTLEEPDVESDDPVSPLDAPARLNTGTDSVAEDPLQPPPSEIHGNVEDGGAADELMLSTGRPGNLAAFAATGDRGSEQNQDENPSTADGLVWNVELPGRLAVEDLQAGRDVLLAAVRQRHDRVEVVLTDGMDVSRLFTLEQFLNEHPNFSGRHAILLDRRWLRPFNERLLTRGGGWEMWLLLDDALFARWKAGVESALAARGWLFSEVEQIDAVVSLGATKNPQLDIRKMHRREDTTEAASAAQPDPQDH